MKCKLCNKQMANIYKNGFYKGVGKDEIIGYACINVECKWHRKQFNNLNKEAKL